MTLNPFQLRLLRTAIEYFIDAKKDELEYDWVAGRHDEAIASCKAWISDAEELDEVLKVMYRDAVTRKDGDE